MVGGEGDARASTDFKGDDGVSKEHCHTLTAEFGSSGLDLSCL